jgi:CBS domain-containing protein
LTTSKQNRQSAGSEEMIIKNCGALIGDQDPLHVAPSTTVLEAARRMAERRVGAVAVVDDGRLVGLFTERDLLNRVVALGQDPDAMTVDEVMTREPITIRADRSLADALDIMFGNKFRHLPVLDETGGLMGVMSCRDVPASYQEMRKRFRKWRGEFENAA